MTFKEFNNWVNAQACRGQWTVLEFMVINDICKKVQEVPFWKREKCWRENYAQDVIREIVNPINRRGGEPEIWY